MKYVIFFLLLRTQKYWFVKPNIEQDEYVILQYFNHIFIINVWVHAKKESQYIAKINVIISQEIYIQKKYEKYLMHKNDHSTFSKAAERFLLEFSF